MTIDIVLFVVVGLVSGYASGLFGIGGGLFRIPILLHMMPLLGVPAALGMHVSAGTSLAVAVPTSLSASRSQQKAGNLDRELMWAWLPALAVGVVFGILGTQFVPGRVLEMLFVVMMLLAAARMLIARAEDKTQDGEGRTHLPSRTVLALLAFAIGVISPMVGIVGGTFATPVLTTLRYPIHRAVAISSIGGLVVSVLGAIGFAITGWDATGLPARFIGYIDPMAFLLMTPCVLATVPLGVWTANRLSPQILGRLFGVMLVLIAADVGWRVLFGHG